MFGNLKERLYNEQGAICVVRTEKQYDLSRRRVTTHLCFRVAVLFKGADTWRIEEFSSSAAVSDFLRSLL